MSQVHSDLLSSSKSASETVNHRRNVTLSSLTQSFNQQPPTSNLDPAEPAAGLASNSGRGENGVIPSDTEAPQDGLRASFSNPMDVSHVQPNLEDTSVSSVLSLSCISKLSAFTLVRRS